MQVELQPADLPVTAGQPAVVTVELLNDDIVIEGYGVRVLGADPAWVDVQPPTTLSLFPGTRGVATVLLTLPERYPAGSHRLVVQVYSASDPAVYQLVELNVHVAEAERLDARLEPTMVTVSRTARFGLVVTNTGNTEVAVRPVASDAEDVVRARFTPELVLLPPGEQTVVAVAARGRRPWFGVPVARQLAVALRGNGVEQNVTATILQRPRIGRGLMGLVGMLAAATVFGLVLRSVFKDVVSASKVDDAVLEQAVGETDQDADVVGAAPLTVSGQVLVSGVGAGAEGLTVELYGSDDPAEPRQTAATDGTGSFLVANVVAGPYRVRVTGGGFDDVWYPAAISFETADDVLVKPGQSLAGLTMEVVGKTGSVSGKVVATEPGGAQVRLFGPAPPAARAGSVPPAARLGPASAVPAVSVPVAAGLAATGPGPATAGPIPTGPVAAGPTATGPGPAARRRSTDVEVAATVTLADGSFVLADVPAPADYELEVTLAGFLAERRPFHLDPGEARKGMEITLRRGAGSIKGGIIGPNGPLGGVLVTATDGTTTVETTSLTTDPVGSFVVANLVTPARYTLTVTREGFRPEVLQVGLGDGQQLTGVVIVLASGTAELRGTVRKAGGDGLGGVTVRVSNGAVTMATQSSSVGAVGSFSLAGLPAPSTYTVTFDRAGFQSAVRTIELDPNAAAGANALDVELVGVTATVRGTAADGNGPLAGVAVSIADGTTTRTVQTADEPRGAYLFEGVAAGTYTVTFQRPGAAAQTVLVTLAANEDKVIDMTVGAQASLSGRVLVGNLTPAIGLTVTLYRAGEYPANPLGSTTTNSSGRYAFAALSETGTFVLAFTNSVSHILEVSAPFTVDGGQQVVVDHSLLG